jgi:hypothetical protein
LVFVAELLMVCVPTIFWAASFLPKSGGTNKNWISKYLPVSWPPPFASPFDVEQPLLHVAGVFPASCAHTSHAPSPHLGTVNFKLYLAKTEALIASILRSFYYVWARI